MNAAVQPVNLVALLIVCCGIAMLLRQRASEQSFLFCTAVVCTSLFLILPSMGELLMLLDELAAVSDSENTQILVKAFGIGLVTELGSELCSDHGQRAFAKQIETAGRITILLLCVPMLRELISMLTGMM